MHRIIHAVLFILGTVTAVGSAAMAGLPENMDVAVLHATDGASSDHFGDAVSISGDVCVVGAPDDDDLGGDSGSAHVFRFNGSTWEAEAKLTASNGDAGDQFGSAVAISTGRIVVGAKKHDSFGSNAGAVYVFTYTDQEWSQTAYFVAPDTAAGDQFGTALAVSGETMIVGSKGDDDAGTSSGSVHLFDATKFGWAYRQKLTASDAGPGDFFGRAVALSGNVAIVGAYGDDLSGVNRGSAYVFRRGDGAWSQEQKLTTVVSDNAYFGWSVGATDNIVVVGAPEDEFSGTDAGTVHTFRFDAESGTWTQDGLLVPGNATDYDHFGHCVAIDQNVIAASAPYRDNEFPDAGVVYLYRHDGVQWVEDSMVSAPQPYYWDEFGTACAFAGNTLIAGAPEDDDDGNNAGSAAILRFNGITVCGADFDGSGMVDYSDIFILIDAWGPCDGCPQDLNGDGEVGQTDLVLLIGLWGPCD